MQQRVCLQAVTHTQHSDDSLGPPVLAPQVALAPAALMQTEARGGVRCAPQKLDRRQLDQIEAQETGCGMIGA